MTNINELNSRKLELTTLYEQIFTDIGYIHNSNLSKLNKASTIKLKDVFVPLTSNLHIDLFIEGNKLKKLIVFRNEEEIGSYDGVTVVSNKKYINNEFFELLFVNVSNFVFEEAPDVPGIRLQKRPLIFEPIWSDGYKRNFAVIDVPSALNIFNRVVLLGPPGSGKSTTAKIIAASHLTHFLEHSGPNNLKEIGLWSDKPLVPIFVEVKNLVSSAHFPDINSAIGFNEYLEYIKVDILKKQPKFIRIRNEVFGRW